MLYRDDQEALRLRRIALEDEKRELDKALTSLAPAKARADEIDTELEKLARLEKKRVTLPLLQSVSIKSPCPEKWDGMQGTEQVRFCGRCEQNVYNLSAMTADQADAFLAHAGGDACVRLYRRSDGTVMTSDCVGGRKQRRKVRWVAGVTAAAMAVASAAIGYRAVTEVVHDGTKSRLTPRSGEGWDNGGYTLDMHNRMNAVGERDAPPEAGVESAAQSEPAR